jgi:hypothetical protein
LPPFDTEPFFLDEESPEQQVAKVNDYLDRARDDALWAY